MLPFAAVQHHGSYWGYNRINAGVGPAAIRGVAEIG